MLLVTFLSHLFVTATVSIPPRMVQDQFGIMGLLTFIRGADNDPNLVALALGRCVWGVGPTMTLTYSSGPRFRHLCVWGIGTLTYSSGPNFRHLCVWCICTLTYSSGPNFRHLCVWGIGTLSYVQ